MLTKLLLKYQQYKEIKAIKREYKRKIFRLYELTCLLNKKELSLLDFQLYEKELDLLIKYCDHLDKKRGKHVNS